ncbi:MAG: hypothetical protein KatS3mg032_0013 [Cyclobacteriaceae bacterium]|nr:MAG: hypothetical protein KatS3mg032_0013 [Cyclobacteriaceae bacterium]
MPGIFTISLDFELHWGGFEKWPLATNGYAGKKAMNRYFLNTRQIIPRLLNCFEHYQVHATWAAVGLLLHENRRQLEAGIPSLKPTYRHRELSAYHYLEKYGIGLHEADDPFHYAHTLVKQILATPGQELGSHTFSHYYCNEAGQTPEQFRADLRAAKRASTRYGVRPRSLVFPRNQFNDAYLKVCAEEGFNAVRSNPPVWFWNINTRNESRWKRFNRGLDAYLPWGKDYTYDLSSLSYQPGMPVRTPASRLLRPYRPEEMMLNELKIRRIEGELRHAAKTGKVYHLWWHPHNFGFHPEENMKGLNRILDTFGELSKQYGMVSMNMGEIADQIILRSHGHAAA